MYKYAVVVGNIGTVITTNDIFTALNTFTDYVELSNAPHGRASGEEVSLMEDGEPTHTHPGRLYKEPRVFCDGCGEGFTDGDLFTIKGDTHLVVCWDCKNNLTRTSVDDILNSLALRDAELEAKV